MSRSSADLEDLARDAAAGNEAAWWLLWESVEPKLERLLKSPRVTGRLSQDVDDVRNILVAVMEKLLAENCRRLKSYVEQKQRKKKAGFEAWLVVLTKRVAIDYMRAHQDFKDRRREMDASSTGGWVVPNELPSDSVLVGARPPVTNRGAALTLLRYAYDCLPEDHMKALELWILNHPYEHISDQLALGSADEANKIVRAALERLRRRFRDSSAVAPG